MEARYLNEIRRGTEVPENADFAVIISGHELEPFFQKGDTAFFERNCELEDGDVGLFELSGRALIRQYCEDSEGTVYLFAVNRKLKRLDAKLSKEDTPILLGKLILPSPIPLP